MGSTKGKWAELALEETATQLQGILDYSPFIIFMRDTEGIYLLMNRQAERVYGIKIEDVLGKTNYDLFPKEMADRTHREDQEIIKTKKISRVEETLVIKDKQRTFLTTKFPILDREGKPTAVCGISFDITRQKTAEEELRNNEKLFRMLYEEAPLAYQSLDKKRNILEVNKAWLDMLRYPRKEVIGKPFSKFLTPESKKRFEKNFPKFLAAGEIYDVEYEVVQKGGSHLSVECDGRVGYDEKRKFRRTHCILRDVTERKQAEEKLRESEEKLKHSFEGAAIGMSLVGTKGNFLEVNPTLCEITGYSEEELLSKTFQDITHSEDLKMGADALRQTISGEIDRAKLKKRYIRKDGRTIWVSITVSLLRDVRGNPSYFVAQTQDITKRMEAEAELKTYREDLEEMVVERTTDVKESNEALRESEKRYRGLFEDSPISLWEEDFSGVKKRIESLRSKGVKDFRKYFDDRPKAIADFGPLVKIVDVNKATLKLYKAKSKKELLRGLDVVFGKESYDTFRDELIAIAEGRTVFESETIEHTLTGKKIHVALRWAVATGYEETLTKVLVSISDITERKLAEEEKNRLFKAIAASSEGISIADEKDRYIYVNEAHGRIYGYPPEELIGKTWKDLVPPEAVAPSEKAIAETLHNKDVGVFGGETSALRKDGTTIPTEITATALWDEKGNYAGHICHVMDIAERKRADEELKQKMEELEKINKFMVGRELRMAELKKHIKELEANVAKLE